MNKAKSQELHLLALAYGLAVHFNDADSRAKFLKLVKFIDKETEEAKADGFRAGASDAWKGIGSAHE